MLRRACAIFCWILLGALTSGASVGYFLSRANDDRRALAAQNQQIRDQAEKTLHDTQALADEANRKLSQASTEVDRAQALVKTYADELRVFHQADVFPPANPFVLRAMHERVSVPLGVSIRLPVNAQLLPDDQTLTGIKRGTDTAPTSSWLIVRNYDAAAEQLLLSHLLQTQPRTYFSQGRLFIGVRGTIDDQSGIGYLFHIQRDATSTHLVWLRTEPFLNEDRLLNILSSVSFSH